MGGEAVQQHVDAEHHPGGQGYRGDDEGQLRGLAGGGVHPAVHLVRRGGGRGQVRPPDGVGGFVRLRPWGGPALQEQQQVAADVGRRPVTADGVLLEAPHHYGLQLRSQVRIGPGGRGGFGGYMLVGHRDGGLPRERRSSGQHLVQHHPQAVDVGALVGGVAAGLFGAEVGGGPDHGTVLGQFLRVVPHPRHPEVGHLDRAVRRQQDVSGLDVAVDHPASMGHLQSGGHFGGDLGRPAGQELPLGVEDIPQRTPGDQLHDDVVGALLLPPVVDRHDVGMAQVGGGLGFLAEPGDEGVGVGVALMHDLYRHPAVQGAVDGLEHVRHAAPRYVRNQVVAPQ